jgi:MerR family transcriptional regulator/heat shock protein HspR
MKSLENNNSSEPVYTLAVASKLSFTPTHSIRQYIDKGLIIPFKTDTKRHLFSEVDILRLKCIRNYLHDQGLNIAGINALFSIIPCWIIRPCDMSDRLECEAYTSIKSPCWMASNKGLKCLNTDCRQCEVYKLPEKCAGPKEFIKLITNT